MGILIQVQPQGWSTQTAPPHQKRYLRAGTELVFPAPPAPEERTDDIEIEWQRIVQAFEEVSTLKETNPGAQRVRKLRTQVWWNNSCYQAKVARRAALRKLQKNMNYQHLLEYREQKARARRTIRQTKRAAWRTFCASLSTSDQSQRLWSVIRALNGKIKRNDDFPTLTDDQQQVLISPQGKANFLVQKLFPDQTWVPVDDDLDRGATNYELEADFTLEELTRELDNLVKITSPGSDGINYTFYKQLPTQWCLHLLYVYNLAWAQGSSPIVWRDIIVVPIKKPGKDGSNWEHFRPISLINCGAKIFHRMICRRLSTYVERNSLLSPYQCGGRRNHASTDGAHRIISIMQQARREKEHLWIILLDAKKAYDLFNPGMVCQQFAIKNIRGRMERWATDLLRCRRVRVRVGSTLSRSRLISWGLPQGSPLSPLLYNLGVDSLYQEVTSQANQFYDDIAAWVLAPTKVDGERKIQDTADAIGQWANKCGVEFNTAKSQLLVISRSPTCRECSDIYLNGQIIPRARQAKYLGVTIHENGSATPHFLQRVKETKPLLKLLRYLASTTWGARASTLIRVYDAVVAPKLCYGAHLWPNAAASAINSLQVVQNEAFRNILSLPRDTRILDLHALISQPLIRQRLEQDALKGTIRAQFLRLPCTINSVAQEESERACHFLGGKERHLTTDRIPVLNPQCLGMLERPQPSAEDCNPRHLQPQAAHDEWLRDTHRSDTFYTDGSRAGAAGAACAYHAETQLVRARKLPGWFSSTEAELVGIILALEWAAELRSATPLLLTDSQNAVQIITKPIKQQDTLSEWLNFYVGLCHTLGLHPRIDWIRGHSGIKGNNIADKFANQARLNLSLNVMILPTKAAVSRELRKQSEDETIQMWLASAPTSGLRANFSTKEELQSFKADLPSLPRKEYSFVIRVAMDKILHGRNLFKWGRVHSPECTRCPPPKPEDSLEHWLLFCPTGETKRQPVKALAEQLGIPWTVGNLLRATHVLKLLVHLWDN